MSVRLSSSARRASSQLNVCLTRRTCATLTLQRSFWNGARRAASSTGAKRRATCLAGMAGLAVMTAMTATTIFLDADIEPTRIDPDTNIAFPETLVVPSKARFPPFTLLGVGVRTVSFLGIKVYSVGFYADMTNPNLNIPEGITPEEKVRYIISNTACAIRIIPTRSTSYTHLRDSYIRTLQARLTAALKQKTISEEVAEEVQSPLRKLKSLFPNTSFAKHTALDIILTAPPKNASEKRAIVVRELGVVENDWIAQELFLAYFEGNGISPPMKKSVLATFSSKTAP